MPYSLPLEGRATLQSEQQLQGRALPKITNMKKKENENTPHRAKAREKQTLLFQMQHGPTSDVQQTFSKIAIKNFPQKKKVKKKSATHLSFLAKVTTISKALSRDKKMENKAATKHMACE